MNRRHVAAWAWYDFANSIYPAVITATVFSVYFAGVIVGNDDGRGDFVWGLAVSTSAGIVAATSPIMGAIADRSGLRKQLLVTYSVVCALATASFWFLQPGMVWIGFALVLVANTAFEGALVFYNAYLPEIAPPEERGRVSGIGYSVGYLGSAVGLAVAIPFIQAEQYRLLWVVVATLYLVFALPSFLILPNDTLRVHGVGEAAREGVKGFIETLKEVRDDPQLRRFLLAFFLYIDGVLTVIYFASIFAAGTLGFEGIELLLLFLVVQISALVGAFALARPSDVWGPRAVITLSLVAWTALGVSAYFVQTKPQFWTVAVLAGFNLGSVQAASRSLWTLLIPEGKEAAMFGFYAFCGRASSILGPLVFGGVSVLTGGNQRLSVIAITAFFLVGGVLLQRVEDPVRAS